MTRNLTVGIVNGLRYYSWSHKVVCCRFQLPVMLCSRALGACVGLLFMECRLIEAPFLHVPGYQSEGPLSCNAQDHIGCGIAV